MRDGFKSGLIKAAQSDSLIHVLTGDHGYALFDEFRQNFPDRFHNVGVAEANLIGIAAGMAKSGLRPVVYGLAAFIPNRVFEFIKMQIALEGLPVVMVGDGAGLVYSQLGKSHQTLEDLAIIGSLPQVRSMSPGSDLEMEIAILWATKQDFPTYLRMGKMGGGYNEAAENASPKPHRFHTGAMKSTAAVIAHGSMVSAIKETVASVSTGALDFWSCPTIFPIDPEFIDYIKQNYELVMTIEEHQPRGGLADEISRNLRETEIKVRSLSANPNSTSLVGSYEWLLGTYGLGQSAIASFIGASLN